MSIIAKGYGRPGGTDERIEKRGPGPGGTREIYIKTAESGNKRAHGFCPECGTPIYATSPGPHPSTYGRRVGGIDQRAQFVYRPVKSGAVRRSLGRWTYGYRESGAGVTASCWSKRRFCNRGRETHGHVARIAAALGGDRNREPTLQLQCAN